MIWMFISKSSRQSIFGVFQRYRITATYLEIVKRGRLGSTHVPFATLLGRQACQGEDEQFAASSRNPRLLASLPERPGNSITIEELGDLKRFSMNPLKTIDPKLKAFGAEPSTILSSLNLACASNTASRS